MNLVTQLESRFGVALDMDEIVGLDSVERCVRSSPESVRAEAAQPAAPLVTAPSAHADAAPEKTAFAGRDGEISYGALARMVAAAAARIVRIIGGAPGDVPAWSACGLPVGERVVLCGPNSPQLAAAYFAVHAAGGVAVLLDADTPDDGLHWAVEDAEARLVILGGAA